jgi:hypothetical protein
LSGQENEDLADGDEEVPLENEDEEDEDENGEDLEEEDEDEEDQESVIEEEESVIDDADEDPVMEGEESEQHPRKKAKLGLASEKVIHQLNLIFRFSPTKISSEFGNSK